MKLVVNVPDVFRAFEKRVLWLTIGILLASTFLLPIMATVVSITFRIGSVK